MRTNRKIMAVVLALVMALSLLPVSAFAAGSCNHMVTDENAGTTTTLEEKSVSTSFDCTQVAYLKDCKVCSVCGKAFSNYESTAEGTVNLVTDAVYTPDASAAHVWTNGNCTNLVGTNNCGATHTHTKFTSNNTCDDCGFVCQHDGETGAVCTVCGADLSGGGNTDKCTGDGTTCKVEASGTHEKTCSVPCTEDENCTWDGTHKAKCPKKSDTETLTAPTVTYTHSTKTVTWSAIPTDVDAKLGLYSDTNGTDVSEFQIIGVTGTSHVLTDEEIGTIDLNGKYFGVAFTKGSETVIGYSAAISTSDETPTDGITNLKYDGKTLTWTYVGSAQPVFKLTVSEADTDNVFDVDMNVTDDTSDNFTFSYTLPSTITHDVKLTVSLASDPSVYASIEYTVGGGSTTPVDKADQIIAATENMNTTTSADDVQAVLGSNDTEKKDLVENASNATIKAVAAMNTKRGVTTESTGTTNNTKTSAWLGTVAPANATIKLEAKPATERTLPSGCANSTTVSIELTINNRVEHGTLAGYIPVWLTIPSEFGNGKLIVRHFTSNGNYEDITPTKESTTVIRFVTKSFSDFQVLELEEGVTEPGSSGSSSGGNKSPNRGSSSGAAATPTPPVTVTTNPSTSNASGFSDVPDSHTFASEIKWAKENGYMNGTGDGVFSPSGTVNRQQLWMVLARIAGANPADMAAAKDWAVENGISDGTTPTGPVSRQQLVTMMYRFAALMGKATEGSADLGTYPDSANVSGYAQEALAWAVANGIVNGTSTGSLNPWGGATRGAFAAILYRYYNA